MRILMINYNNMKQSVEVEVLCVQLACFHLQPVESMEKAAKMLSGYEKADFLVLPEMAFTGYAFENREEIEPLLEEPNEIFPTFRWCAEQARRLGAYVFCGYTEKEGNNAYNSMMVLDPQGRFLRNCRKNYLYVNDKTWALPGDNFESVVVNIKGNEFKVGLGICLDINPDRFDPTIQEFELANFWLRENADFCIFCANWTAEDDDEGMKLVNYWIGRLRPLLGEKKRWFVAANRIGEERGIRYMGNSCVVELGQESRVLTRLGRYNEEVLRFILSTSN